MAQAVPVTSEWKLPWRIPTALLLIICAGAMTSWGDPWIVPAAAAQKALVLEQFARGGAVGYALAAFHASAWIGIVILLRPMLLLAFVVLVEAWLSPKGRPREKRLLAWTVRAVFLAITYLIGTALNRYATFLPGPLFNFAGASSPTGLRMLEMGSLLIVSMLVIDFFQYWAHRAYHRFPLLWKFHAVHHSPRNLDVLNKFEHPLEGVVSWFLIALPVNALIVGVDTNQLDILAAFFLVQTHLIHMNAPVHLGPIGHLLVDNRYHFIHHSRDPRHFDTNFAAVFPVFDKVFGTYRKPEGNELPETGIEGRLQPARLSHYFLAHLPEERRS
jgi:sterol desaturase/sphingolipid hydroxylase (fatty acid hydroxylase superfamily)